MSVRWSGLTTRYEVAYTDGESVQVRVGIPDVLRWETNHKGASLLANTSVTSMLQCVWYALRRQGLSEVKDFDQWVATVADFGQVEDAQEQPDPSNADQSGD